jgi:hypothetical protein
VPVAAAISSRTNVESRGDLFPVGVHGSRPETLAYPGSH